VAESLTPRQVVAELDKYIVGQNAAKKAVAVAIRNRWRRQQLPADMRTDVKEHTIPEEFTEHRLKRSLMTRVTIMFSAVNPFISAEFHSSFSSKRTTSFS